MNKKLKEEILKKAKGFSLPFLFGIYQEYFGSIYHNPEVKDTFLLFLEELVKDGHLRFANSGVYLLGTAKEQVEQFRKVWPEEYDDGVFEKDIEHLWWWSVAPAGAVWVWEDGSVTGT
ncbi:hypothetical protein EV693_102238 [Nicoletella semolina]|uniref:DUF596 domain-containing protein n=1 Tax=Nicoletella semolina TaxID=271160 RepID=A0A4R2NBY0_9PAST|nr:DUF596 domain-containing protein [Nicoletella semolina]MDH2925010.1 hypothetical protein [Nicoletella semolina]TCP18558.1 hypothetical protein EV693_102238 [Nicoletella semolina]